jgi:hypothetical protein
MSIKKDQHVSDLDSIFDTGMATAADPYYDHSKKPLIAPEDVTGRTQKMNVVFVNPNFRKDYHVQWVDESKFSEYAARGFQLVRKDWVASTWTHALSGTNGDQSDKIRMAVGIGEGGATQYNILMFTTRELFDRMESAAHNAFNSMLNTKDEQLAQTQRNVLDASLIRRKNGF